jgi:hypothetical protein
MAALLGGHLDHGINVRVAARMIRRCQWKTSSDGLASILSTASLGLRHTPTEDRWVGSLIGPAADAGLRSCCKVSPRSD